MRSIHSVVTRRRFTLAAAALLLLGLTVPASAQRGAWEFLGSKEVDGGADHDRIKCHGKDEYRALQFRVEGAAVTFDRIVVEYGNHQKKAYPFRMTVAPNGKTPVLDLAGGYRDITDVEFWYRKASWGKKPEVRLYGRR